MPNDVLLGIRVPQKMKDNLDNKYPDTRVRNNVIRALIQKLIEGKITVQSYEIDLQASS
jgi:hypothetical protein